ncbi:hypothetical protein EDC01DRAFT_791732 [Geopyxis carbonaria]|nr:hypothetical protein EDC01DRAFT_791732 [Geopyxis carbonaria]
MTTSGEHPPNFQAAWDPRSELKYGAEAKQDTIEWPADAVTRPGRGGRASTGPAVSRRLWSVTELGHALAIQWRCPGFHKSSAAVNGRGIAGVIKVTMMLQTGLVPGNAALAAGEPRSELIKWEEWGVQANKDTTEWRGVTALEHASAISQVFGNSDRPVFGGSIKANIGHTEPVSGIAGRPSV